MKKWLLRLLVGIVSATALLALFAWLTLRASLPALDGDFELAGISADASIARDASGIPTISAATRADLAFATGYAHAQDRFFQMDLVRRRSAGELSELFGVVAIDADKRYRLHRFRSRAREVLAKLPAADADLLQRYSEGVNAGLASLTAKPFEYFLLRAEPQTWRPEDSVLVVYTMFLMLNDSRATKDLQRGLAHRVLPQEVYSWMYPQGTPWDAPMMGDARPIAAIPSADMLSLRDVIDAAPAANEIGKPALNGSNNWAVDGSLTKTGRAIVSNDMHLGLSAPNIYYQARLIVDGDAARDLVGVTMPGTPFVVAGSNKYIAWGYTNSYGDWTDAVVLRPGAEPATYQTADGDMPFIEYRESIRVKGADARELIVRETVWGPVDDSANYPDGDIAVSWIAHDAQAVNLRLVDLERAKSVQEALDIANTMGMPPQNFVTGDADGNIGWTIA
ncbi:MAG: penicillin acylase family protein, partial [Gammaproteobacteria bacterium]|nr:penicillin acylase family protein [Gammaproteobacteria bacterium]